MELMLRQAVVDPGFWFRGRLSLVAVKKTMVGFARIRGAFD